MLKHKLALSVVAIAMLAVSVVSAAPVGSALGYGSKSIDYKCVAANGSITYNQLAFAGEVVTIDVAGSDWTDLQLFVYDEFGNLIASDVSYGNECFVVFTANYTEYVTIEVVNNSFYSNCYGITVTYT